MPQKLTDCVAAVTKQLRSRHPEWDAKRVRSSAWAICVSSTGLKPHHEAETMSEPHPVQIGLSEADCHQAACGKRSNYALTKGDNVSDWALPYKNCDGSVNKGCTRNALARWNQAQGYSSGAKQAALAKLRRAARSVGIDVSDEEFELPPDPIFEDFQFQSSIVIKERKTTEKEPMIIVSGVAINATTTSNLNTYLPEELQKAAATLRGVKVYKDHNYSTDSVVGRVTDARFNGSRVEYEAVLMASDSVVEKVELGLIDSVSIGAKVGEIYCSICGEPKGTCRHVSGREYDGSLASDILRDIEFFEMSLVSIPADKEATLSVSHSFDSAVLGKVRVAESYWTEVEVPKNHKHEVEPRMSQGTTSEHEQLKALESEKATLAKELASRDQAMVEMKRKLAEQERSTKVRLARDITAIEASCGDFADEKAQAARKSELEAKEIPVLEAIYDTVQKRIPSAPPAAAVGQVSTTTPSGRRELAREEKKALIRRLFRFSDPLPSAVEQLDGYNPLRQEWKRPKVVTG